MKSKYSNSFFFKISFFNRLPWLSNVLLDISGKTKERLPVYLGLFLDVSKRNQFYRSLSSFLRFDCPCEKSALLVRRSAFSPFPPNFRSDISARNVNSCSVFSLGGEDPFWKLFYALETDSFRSISTRIGHLLIFGETLAVVPVILLLKDGSASSFSSVFDQIDQSMSQFSEKSKNFHKKCSIRNLKILYKLRLSFWRGTKLFQSIALFRAMVFSLGQAWLRTGTKVPMRFLALNWENTSIHSSSQQGTPPHFQTNEESQILCLFLTSIPLLFPFSSFS